MYTKEQIQEFKEVTKPLVEWLNTNAHPHTAAYITVNGGELLESQLNVITEVTKDE